MSNFNPDISTSLPNKKWQLYIYQRFFPTTRSQYYYWNSHNFINYINPNRIIYIQKLALYVFFLLAQATLNKGLISVFS